MKQIDSEILTRCQSGDKAAFHVVVQTYQQMVWSLTLRMLCDEEEAKDATQEAFIKVWVNIRRYDGSSSFSTWVYSIASRTFLVLECVVVVMTTESPFSSSYVSVRVVFMSNTHDVIMILHANTANVPHKMLVFFIIIVLI